MTHTFASAYKRLQEIHKDISSQDIIDIDILLQLQNEAKELHDYLQSRLAAVKQPEDNDTTA